MFATFHSCKSQQYTQPNNPLQQYRVACHIYGASSVWKIYFIDANTRQTTRYHRKNRYIIAIKHANILCMQHFTPTGITGGWSVCRYDVKVFKFAKIQLLYTPHYTNAWYDVPLLASKWKCTLYTTMKCTPNTVQQPRVSDHILVAAGKDERS